MWRSRGVAPPSSWVAVTAGLFLAGCSGDMPALRSDNETPVLGIERDLRIDGYEADLVPVSWMGVAPDGTLALIQAQDHQVRFFDQTGTERGAVGREGEGPGEFARLVRGGWLGDTLWVSDPQLSRVTLISSSGEVLRTSAPVRAAYPKADDAATLPVFMFLFPFGYYSGDTALAFAMGGAGDPKAEAMEGGALIRMSSDGVVDRLVLELPPNDASIQVRHGSAVTSVSIPFFPRPQWAVSPDGNKIVTVVTDVSGPEAGTFRVTLYDARTGLQIFSRPYRFEGDPIPDSVVDSVLTDRTARARVSEVRRVYESDVRGRVPSVYPPVIDVVLGGDGRIWIGLRATEQGNPWFGLDPVGEPIGTMVLPTNVELQAAEADQVWGLESDSLDIESVVRYRLQIGK